MISSFLFFIFLIFTLGIRIGDDLNLMKENGQYDENYKVNGIKIFAKSRKDSEKILEDFFNVDDIIALVFELRGLYFFKILFYNANVYS